MHLRVFTNIPAKRRQEVTAVEWSEYMIMAAQHSRKSASLWFRYLRKYIDQCGSLFSIQDVENLYRNDALTPFQRVSLKAAFQDESPTRQYIISLNQRVNPSRITSLKEKYEHTDSHK